MTNVSDLFDVEGRVAVVTGGGGVLCSVISQALGRAGAKVAVLDRIPAAAEGVADSIKSEGGEALALSCDVLDKATLEEAADAIVKSFGGADFLINGAGGNHPRSTTNPDLSFFDIPQDAVQWVFNLNLIGTVLPCQVFGRLMAEAGEGSILNVSSMSALKPLTRIPAYSAAKAAVSNFTQWLSVHLAQEYSTKIRVNALAPGFFLTEQNRFLLTDAETGDLTPRGQSIIAHTPMDRFGEPEDLVGTSLWLLSPASRFVTGVVVPVDGGFSAFGGI